MMEKFSLWLESRTDIVYHVTYYRNLSGISENGLVPNSGYSGWQGKQGWTQDKNFFSSDITNTSYWINKLQDLVFHNYEPAVENPNNFVDEGAIPIVIRFRFNNRQGRWQNDTQSDVGKNDFYTLKSIQPQSIEWWDGRKWKSISDDNIDLRLFVKQEDIEDEPYWEFIHPYPVPH